MSSRYSRFLFDSHPPPKRLHTSPRDSVIPLATVSICTLALLLFSACLCWCRKVLRKSINKTSPEDEGTPRAPPHLQKFKYHHLKRATKCFSEGMKLGKGGFGVVYKGRLRNGKEVAVKKMDLSSFQSEREFQNELAVGGALDSPYVVKLLGYCTHRRRVKLLVYECMQNRSLQEALFEKGYPVHLDWSKRFKIIMGVARALEYLHIHCNPSIIHGDVKPSNILLDSQLSSHLADFGLARLKVEDLLLEMARVSVSTEKIGSDTSDRSRLGTSASLFPVMPQMNSSLNSKGATYLEGSSTQMADNLKPFEASPSVMSPSGDYLCEGALVLHSGSTALNEVNVYASNRAGEMKQNDAFEECEELCSVEGKLAAMGDLGCTGQPDDFDVSSRDGHVLQKRVSKNDCGWQQDVSRELTEKAYVMDWLGSGLPADAQSLQNESVRGQKNLSKLLDIKEDLTVIEESSKREKKVVSNKHRKSREWWKDEYFMELSSKSGPIHNGKKAKMRIENWNFSRELSGHSGELRKLSQNASKDKFLSCSKEWIRSTCSGGATSKFANEGWSGGLFNRQVNGELYNYCRWTGDLNKSGELVSRDASSTTSMRGTVCYVAPENGGSGLLSEKSDIYSFGVLLLVILSGRRPIQVTASPMKEFERANLITWARNLSQTGQLLDLMDEKLHGEYDREQAILCITLALLCLQRAPTARPSITEIVKTLTGEISVPAVPLELSPSPPARSTYKSKHRLDHQMTSGEAQKL